MWLEKEFQRRLLFGRYSFGIDDWYLPNYATWLMRGCCDSTCNATSSYLRENTYVIHLHDFVGFVLNPICWFKKTCTPPFYAILRHRTSSYHVVILQLPIEVNQVGAWWWSYNRLIIYTLSQLYLPIDRHIHYFIIRYLNNSVTISLRLL